MEYVHLNLFNNFLHEYIIFDKITIFFTFRKQTFAEKIKTNLRRNQQYINLICPWIEKTKRTSGPKHERYIKRYKKFLQD